MKGVEGSSGRITDVESDLLGLIHLTSLLADDDEEDDDGIRNSPDGGSGHFDVVVPSSCICG